MSYTEIVMPLARTEELIIEELPDELLIYDLKNDNAHCLNRSSAFVWKHCDGTRTVGQVAHLLEAELQMHVDVEVVWLALQQLEKYRLLKPAAIPAAKPNRISRRELVSKYAPASLALPLIISIAAPTLAQLGSQLANGQNCSLGLQCQSGNCCCGSCTAQPCNLVDIGKGPGVC